MMRRHLQILDFSRVPQMRELRERFIQLCFDSHPDKGGSDKKFQELLEAKDQVSKFILQNVPENADDKAEVIARKESSEVSIIRVNKSSVTVKYPSNYAVLYERCLENRYGSPIDNSTLSNGKKYSLSDGIFVANYMKSDSRTSTL